MKSILVPAFAALLLCAFSLTTLAQDRPQAYTGATVIPINGPAIPDGVLVIH
ncbi:MAG: hypothetical protein H0X14_00815, partial [Acidobacteria bacterium]|nr:hypothetical protein [Acidobacteriota bacterium]